MISNFIYYILFQTAVLLIALMPFRVLYWFSNFAAFMLRNVVQYRIKVVRRNLVRSLPEKSKVEIIEIEKAFYRNLADTAIESLKGFFLTKKTIKKRYYITNPEVVNEYFDKGVSVIGLTGHLSNWEWGALSGKIQLKHNVAAFYKPIQNKLINFLFKRNRERFGTELVSIENTEEFFEEKMDKPYLYILVADQSPSDLEKAFWVTFFNQDTPCLHGPEKYSHLYNYPLIFIDIQRYKRGYYAVCFTKLEESPRTLKLGEVTRLYMNQLESTIKTNPSDWLWSHRRWKRKRPKYMVAQPQHKQQPI
ncbi:MAG TPA: hypothetical protein PL017_07115 [Tenuifilaceae bacterium]|nr:hypothetical protein [Tenuifilaceae bacterium]HPE17124.1 hypothetical protein [Tenuifilaceae bacterium]HPJ45852.1 hypothetical protein [Tenuifilaceae bacterium]HPQ34117.1 hypothetical protein [Tenuifilaceae bacterium]HRX68695.1 hypothetical protein [Tenuifilaceae bacterium]